MGWSSKLSRMIWYRLVVTCLWCVFVLCVTLISCVSIVIRHSFHLPTGGNGGAPLITAEPDRKGEGKKKRYICLINHIAYNIYLLSQYAAIQLMY